MNNKSIVDFSVPFIRMVVWENKKISSMKE